MNIMNEEIIRNLNYRIDRALDYTRQMVEDDNMSERIEECKIRAELFIAKNPLKSVAGGLLAGWIIGKLLSDD